MRNLVSYMFISLDGFIADREGGSEWVPIDDELMRFANDYFSSAHGIVFGRNVYEGFVAYWDGLDATEASVTALEAEFAEIFGTMRRIVVSRSLDEVDGEAILIKDHLAEAISDLKRQPGGDLLLICGPELRSTLARLGSIDRYRSLVAPVVLGGGKPAFEDVGEPVSLVLAGTRVFDGGVVMLDLEPAR